MERLDADSGVFSTASCAMEDSLTSPTLSINSIDGFPTIAVNGEDANRRVSELTDMVNDMRLRSQWGQTVQLYGGAFASSGEVHVRYTLDGWATWTEVRASFIDSSSNGAHDLFSFSLFLPYDLPTDSRCEFCVRYSVGDKQFWDSNDGANYVLDFCSPQSAFSGRSSMSGIDPGWSHFLY
uniref:CBM21 domain-containing protein n=1 Tax=Plectus sambesii TaxID=2011161 RepID=A0A914VSS1_9BILA